MLSQSQRPPSLTVWTPRAALRLGMLLQDSPVAKAVRDNLLNLVERVIPTQSPTPELPSARERLEVIEFGTNSLERLGGADERTRLGLQDKVRDILLEDKLHSTAECVKIYLASDA